MLQVRDWWQQSQFAQLRALGPAARPALLKRL